MVCLLLFLLFGTLVEADVKITYSAKISGPVTGPWAAGDLINITYLLKPSAMPTVASGMNGIKFLTFGITPNGTATLPFSGLKLTHPSGSWDFATLALNEALLITDGRNGFAGIIEVSDLSAGFQIGNYHLIGVAHGAVWSGLNFDGTTVLDAEQYFANVLGNGSVVASPFPGETSIMDTLMWTDSAGSFLEVTLTPLSLSFQGGGRAENYTSKDDFKQRLLDFGISFGAWPTNFTISSTTIVKFGSIIYAFYSADDSDLDEISASMGTLKIRGWGNGVKKAALAIFFSASDLLQATGTQLSIPSGLTEVVSILISRFDGNGSHVTNDTSMITIEVTTSVQVKHFYRFLDGEKKGKDILTYHGKFESCDSPSALCCKITSPTSTLVGLQGNENSAAPISMSSGLWFALVAFIWTVW